MHSGMSQSRFSRRDFLRISGMTGLAMGLVACTPAAPGQQPTTDRGEAAAPAGEGVTLRWVTNHASIEIPN
ncbi:MAG: twin-arginine translocation signal domain-containing protein, partial [Caldilineaceae bacterium]